MRRGLATLHVAGFPVDFRHFYPRGRVVRLPLYAWQRDRHWIDVGERGSETDGGRVLGPPIEASVAPGTWLWSVRRPGTDPTFVAEALAEAAPVFAPGAISVSNIEFSSEFEGDLQLAVTEGGQFQVAKRSEAGWEVCCRGDVQPIAAVRPVFGVAAATPANGAPHGGGRAVRRGLECRARASPAAADAGLDRPV